VLIGGHQVFEVVKPVEDDVDLAWFLFFFINHEESVLSINIVIRKQRRITLGVGSFEQKPRRSCFECGLRLDGDSHHPVWVSVSIEKLLPVRCPDWLPALIC